jgi:hypothetical protein
LSNPIEAGLFGVIAMMACADEVWYLFEQLWHGQAPEETAIEKYCFWRGCTIALPRIVFQHDEWKFPELFIVTAGLCEKLSCCNSRLSNLIRSWALDWILKRIRRIERMFHRRCFLVSLILMFSLSPLLSARRLLLAPCPTIQIKCLEGERCDGTRSKLLVEIKGGGLELKPTYAWCVSAGTIVGRQGTDTIEIDTSSLTDTWITVVVMIGGLDKACSNVATYRIDVPKRSS